MDPFQLTIALGPVAIYFLLIGLINISTSPVLTTGLRDAAALAIAVSGFAIVGPLKLFVPEPAVSRFGVLVWLLLIGLYTLGSVLLILLLRPRLIFYNVTARQLRPLLASVVERLDDQARWAGDSLFLPHLGVHLHLEDFSPMRGVQLVSTGSRQSLAGWREFELELRRHLRELQPAKNPHGLGFVLISLLMMAAMTIAIVNHQLDFPQLVHDFLHWR